MTDLIREGLFDLVTDPPCRTCEFWDVQGHYCWLKNVHPDSARCWLMNQAFQFLKDNGMVRLSDNQELPVRFLHIGRTLMDCYIVGQQDMLEAKFRKVEEL